jgi:hypothetical protein
VKKFAPTERAATNISTNFPIQLSNSQHARNFEIVIASGAKQSIAGTKVTMDCFVASLLAMTSRHESALSRRDAPELWVNHARLTSEGTGNAGRPPRPQPRVQNKKAHEHPNHGHTGFTRHSLRNGLRLISCSPR